MSSETLLYLNGLALALLLHGLSKLFHSWCKLNNMDISVEVYVDKTLKLLEYEREAEIQETR